MYIHDNSLLFSNMDHIPPCQTGNFIPPMKTRRTGIRDITPGIGGEVEHGLHTEGVFEVIHNSDYDLLIIYFRF